MWRRLSAALTHYNHIVYMCVCGADGDRPYGDMGVRRRIAGGKSAFASPASRFAGTLTA